ncbi:hypothetical protein WMY93_012850 [Mugilogobius chulae]|uniref:3',5'-cyclic-GMP phosphodiesterase n=1 Tax=Mugilogobius chulae TaxID=88201 RepID=A0AAW0P9Z2_9GOBI
MADAAAGPNKAAAPKQKAGGRQFKSAAPKSGGKGFGGVPGADSAGGPEVVCPWESFGDMDLNDLAQFGIV